MKEIRKLTCWTHGIWCLFRWLQLRDQMSIDPGSIMFIERNESVVLKLAVVFGYNFANGCTGQRMQVSQMIPFAVALIPFTITTCHDGHQSDDDYNSTDNWWHDRHRFFVRLWVGRSNFTIQALELFFKHQRNLLQNKRLRRCVSASVGAFDLPFQNCSVWRLGQLLQRQSLKCQLK